MKSNSGQFKKGSILKRKNSGNWRIQTCLICKIEFKKPLSRILIGKGKYCSRICASKGRLGFIPWNKDKKMTNDQKSRLNLSGLELGHGWNKGLPGLRDDKHPNWKGDDVGYNAIHTWIQRKLGKAYKCVKCDGTKGSKRYEWANLDGKYTRDVTTWSMLCSKCHHEHDDIANRGWKTKRRQIQFAY